MQKDLIILVHGTGAADDADVGEAWWQTTSRFTMMLSASWAQTHEIAPPFHWSGANSEAARQQAGTVLLSRLRALDAEGIPYHLVGHSHGGSVIWHSLVQSMQAGKPLNYLRSWTTIGTPFLEFRPIAPSVWRWLSLIVSLCLLAWLLASEGDFRDWPRAIGDAWVEGRSGQIILWCAGWLAIVGLITLAIGRIMFPLLRWARERATIFPAEKRAASAYGARWLALWHPLDEPINGLASTLGAAPPITARLRSGARIFALIPILGPVSNRVVTRAADEFVWTQIARRAQGANRPGFDLVSVGRAPLCLRPGFHAIGRKAADKIEDAANAKAPGTVARLRAVLARGFDAQSSTPVLNRAVTIVSFQELIHTSYFDHEAISNIISDHIRNPFDPKTAPLPGAAQPADTPARIAFSSTPRLTPPLRRQNLELLVAVSLFVVPVALISQVIVAAFFDSAIRPETTAYQLEFIAKTLATPAENVEGSSSDAYGKVIARLARLNVIADPVDELSKLPTATDRSLGAEPVLNWLGERGDWVNVERARISPHLAGTAPAPTPMFFAIQGLISALEGAAATSQLGAPSTSTRSQLDALSTEMTIVLRDGIRPDTIRPVNWTRAVEVLEKFGETQRLEGLVSAISPRDMDASPRRDEVCSIILDMSRLKTSTQHVQHLLDWSKHCSSQSDAVGNLIYTYLAEGAPSLRVPIDTALADDGAPRQELNNIIDDMEKAEGLKPLVYMNIRSLKRLSRLVYRYAKAVIDRDDAFRDEVIGSFASIAQISNDIRRVEMEMVALKFLEQIGLAAPVRPLGTHADQLINLLLAQMRRDTNIIVGQIDTDREPEDHPFVRLSSLLTRSDRVGAADQYLLDVHEMAMREYSDSIAADLKIALSQAAYSIGSRSFGALLEDEARTILVAGFANGKVTDQDVARLALRAEKVARPFDTVRADAALIVADRAAVRIRNASDLAPRLPDLVDAWASRQAYAKARAWAEKATLQRDVLLLYVPILDDVIVRRNMSKTRF